MDFHKRLQRAVERGQRNRDARAREDAAKAMDEEQCRRLHSKFRLELSEHIEGCLKQLIEQFPGFRFETMVGESGWGGAIRRDDIELKQRGVRTNLYSRLEVVVPKFNQYRVLEILAKGTIRNKEVFNRSFYEVLSEVDLESYLEMIDLWIIEYAELYAGAE